MEGVTDVVNEVAEGEVDAGSSDELPGLQSPVRNFWEKQKFSWCLKALFLVSRVDGLRFD